MTSRKPEPGALEILPAIDLRGGRVVRLVRGDFDRETVYDGDPVAVAVRFTDGAATWLHVVDLDGARDPDRRQLDVVAAIIAGVGDRVRLEVAGGLREPAAVERVLAAGAARVVVGTAALADPTFAERLVAAHGASHIAVALDVRHGLAVGHGWARGARGVPAGEAMARLADAGVTIFEVTAIDRDGTLRGPDLALLGELAGSGQGDVIASAGISSAADLRAVRALGCSGAIVGRALYEGRLTIAEAIAAGSA